MTRYLVAAAARPTVAAACDYLDPELAEGDEVYVLTVEETARPVSDREAISRVVQERLADRASVRTIRREGRPDREIVTFARERDVDQVVLGPSRTGVGIGSTTRSVLASVEMPVFVVPG